MLIKLQNGELSVTVDSRGAELQSLDAADGTRYLWDGDARYWSGRSPTLFPIVGALRDGRADSAVGEIRLPKHGLARTAEWQLESADERAAVFSLRPDTGMRSGYPFNFALSVRYSLEGDALTVTYRVKNEGERPMPFFLGGHPAFRVPLSEGEQFEDYIVEFDQPETADCPQVDMAKGLILDSVRNRFMTGTASFHLNHVLFRGDALIFDRLRSRSARLFSRRSGRGVRMDFADFPYFAVWTPVTDSPFVCLEPWTGMATLDTEDDVFEHKRGVRILVPGEEAAYSYTLTVF